MPLSHYRRFVLWLVIFLGGGTASRLPHFFQVVYTTIGRPLIGHAFLTVNNRRMTVLQMLVTLKQPQLTFGSRRIKLPIP